MFLVSAHTYYKTLLIFLCTASISSTECSSKGTPLTDFKWGAVFQIKTSGEPSSNIWDIPEYLPSVATHLSVCPLIINLIRAVEGDYSNSKIMKAKTKAKIQEWHKKTAAFSQEFALDEFARPAEKIESGLTPDEYINIDVPINLETVTNFTEILRFLICKTRVNGIKNSTLFEFIQPIQNFKTRSNAEIFDKRNNDQITIAKINLFLNDTDKKSKVYTLKKVLEVLPYFSRDTGTVGFNENYFYLVDHHRILPAEWRAERTSGWEVRLDRFHKHIVKLKESFDGSNLDEIVAAINILIEKGEFIDVKRGKQIMPKNREPKQEHKTVTEKIEETKAAENFDEKIEKTNSDNSEFPDHEEVNKQDKGDDLMEIAKSTHQKAKKAKQIKSGANGGEQPSKRYIFKAFIGLTIIAGLWFLYQKFRPAIFALKI